MIGRLAKKVQKFRGKTGLLTKPITGAALKRKTTSAYNSLKVRQHVEQRCGVGVSRLKETPSPEPICFIWTIVSFCCSLFDVWAIYLQPKLCLHTVVHLLLEEFKISFQWSVHNHLVTQSPKIRVWVQVFRAAEPESESGVLNFLALESESESHKRTRTPHLL